jgi:hypothetical protein
MKLLALLLVVVAACSGPKAKPESPLVKEGSAVPETCCCKSTPLTSADGQPVYEMTGRMDCSGKPGDCVDEVQCTKGDENAPPPPTM